MGVMKRILEAIRDGDVKEYLTLQFGYKYSESTINTVIAEEADPAALFKRSRNELELRLNAVDRRGADV